MDKFINKLIMGDCLIKLKELEDNSIDSIVTDPPYHLVSIVKRFGGKNSRNTPAMETKEGGVFARKAKGFMGKEWDGVDENGIGIAMNVEMWAECLRVLKPGGHLLAFSGTRTYHRMASAIEDAGFEVRDQIAWCYGQGFPKSLNVFKQLKKKCKCGNMEVYENRIKQVGENSEQEAEYFMRFMQESNLSQTKPLGEKQGEVLQSGLSEQSSHSTVLREESKESSNGGEERILEGGDNLQKTEGELQGSDLPEMSERVFTNGEERRIHNATQVSDGSTPEKIIDENGSGASHRPQSEQQQYREPCAFCKQWGTQATRTLGVGTALKPSIEPICMARKPLAEKTVAENCLKWGTGGINIDESRVDYQSEVDKASATPQGKCTSNTSAGSAPDVDMSEVDYNGERYWYKNEYKWLIDKWLNDEDYVWSELKENLETYDWCKVPEIDSGDRVLFDSGEGVCIRLYESKRKEFVRPEQLGRFPANLLHDNSEEVRECFPETKSGNLNSGHKRGDGTGNSFMGGGGTVTGNYGGDSGNASRFFRAIPNDVVDYNDFLIYNRSILTNIKQLCGQHLTKKKTDIILGGVIQEAERFIQDAELLIFGNSKMEKFLTDTASTIKTLIAQMTELKTLNVLPNWPIMKFTEDYEKTIKLLKELNTEDVKNAESINHLIAFKREMLELIRDIARNVVIENYENGKLQTENESMLMPENTNENIKKNIGERKNFKSIIYQAKASKSERNKGCEGLEDRLGGSLEGGNDKRNGDKPQLKPTKNNHPTVKPIALMEYLIKMVTPKGGIVLDPFAGSGSTLVAAKQNGFQYIGIERDPDYMKIAEARINNSKVQIKLI